MAKTTTKDLIKEETKKQFAIYGYEGISMRNIAKHLDIAPSVIYHHFPSKEILLKEIFDETKKELGNRRTPIDLSDTLDSLLKRRIEFQFDNAMDVTYILKYYYHFRQDFEKNALGYVPKSAYRHIEEVLKYAKKNGSIKSLDIENESKIITHAINGFVLEYYPHVPTGNERTRLVEDLTNFIVRSIKTT